MDKVHQDNLNSIIKSFNELTTAKYKKGQKGHRSNLWEKSGLLDEAINEAIDQAVYLITMKQQLNNKR